MPPKRSTPQTVSSNYVKLNTKQGYQQKRKPGRGGSSTQNYASKLKRDKFKTRYQQKAMWAKDKLTQYTVFDEMNIKASLVSPDDIMTSSRLSGNLANFASFTIEGLNERDLHSLYNKDTIKSRTNSTHSLTREDLIVDDIVFNSTSRTSELDYEHAQHDSSQFGLDTIDTTYFAPSDPSSLNHHTPQRDNSIYYQPDHPHFQPKFLESTLQQHWGYNTFREGQLQSIQSILSGNSALTILPTGSGKSLCYQLPTLLLPGLCLVVSPLLSLMKDQLEQLPRAISAAIWSSNTTLDELSLILYRIKAGSLKLLFVSPEKLLSPLFQRQLLLHLRGSSNSKPAPQFNRSLKSNRVSSTGISFVCVDEVHCLSEWSHGFRPSYLQLRDCIKNIFNCNVILGLTATATQSTTRDLIQKLAILPQNVFSFPRIRPNLILSVCKVQQNNKLSALLGILESPVFKEIMGINGTVVSKSVNTNLQNVITDQLASSPNIKSPQSSSRDSQNSQKSALSGSIIVYCSTQAQSEYVSRALKLAGYNSEFYHAGMVPFQREKVQNMFMRDEVTIIVATIAFGLGINKSNIRAVIHFNHSRTVENYMQEIGRGGRDGQHCYCITLYNDFDSISYHSMHFADLIEFDCIKEFLIDISIDILKSIRYVRGTQELTGIGVHTDAVSSTSRMASPFDHPIIMNSNPTPNNPWVSHQIASPLQQAQLLYNKYSKPISPTNQKSPQLSQTTSSSNKRKSTTKTSKDDSTDEELDIYPISDPSTSTPSPSHDPTRQNKRLKTTTTTTTTTNLLTESDFLSNSPTHLPSIFFTDLHQYDELQFAQGRGKKSAQFSQQKQFHTSSTSTQPTVAFIPNLSIHIMKPNTHYLFTYVISPLLRSMRQSRAKNLFRRPPQFPSLKNVSSLSAHLPPQSTTSSTPTPTSSSTSTNSLATTAPPTALHQGEDDSIDVNLIRYAPQLLTAFNQKLLKKARWKDKSLDSLYQSQFQNRTTRPFGQNSKWHTQLANTTPDQSSMQFQQSISVDQPSSLTLTRTFTSTIAEHDVVVMYDQLREHLVQLSNLHSTTSSHNSHNQHTQPARSMADPYSTCRLDDVDSPPAKRDPSNQPNQSSTFSAYLMLDPKKYADLDIKPSIVDTIITTMSLLDTLDDSSLTDLNTSRAANLCPSHQRCPPPRRSNSSFEAIPATYALARITFVGNPIRVIYSLYLRFCDTLYEIYLQNNNNESDVSHWSNTQPISAHTPTHSQLTPNLNTNQQNSALVVDSSDSRQFPHKRTTFYQLLQVLQLYALVVETFHQNSCVSYCANPVPPYYDPTQARRRHNRKTPHLDPTNRVSEQNQSTMDDKTREENTGTDAQNQSGDVEKPSQSKAPGTLSFAQFETILLGPTQFMTSGTGKYVLDIGLAATRYQLHPSKILFLLSALQLDKLLIVVPDHPSTCLRVNTLPQCFNCLVHRIFYKLSQYHQSMIIKHALMVQLMSVSSIDMRYYYHQLTQLQPGGSANESIQNSSNCAFNPLPYLRVTPQLKLYEPSDTVAQCFLLKEHFVTFLAPPVVAVQPNRPKVNQKAEPQLFHDRLYSDTSSMLKRDTIVTLDTAMPAVVGSPRGDLTNNDETTQNLSLNDDDFEEYDDDDDDICILDSDEEVQEQQLQLSMSLLAASKQPKDHRSSVEELSDTTDSESHRSQPIDHLQQTISNVNGTGWDTSDFGSDTDDDGLARFSTQAVRVSTSKPSNSLKTSLDLDSDHSSDSSDLETSQPNRLLEEDAMLMVFGVGDENELFNDDDDLFHTDPAVSKGNDVKKLDGSKPTLFPKTPSRQLTIIPSTNKTPTELLELTQSAASGTPNLTTFPQYESFPILPHSILQILTYVYFQSSDTTPLLSILSPFSLAFAPTLYHHTLSNLLSECSTDSITTKSTHSDDFQSTINNLSEFFHTSGHLQPPSNTPFNPITSLNHFLHQFLSFVDKDISQRTAIAMIAARVKMVKLFNMSTIKQQSILYFLYSKLFLPCAALLANAQPNSGNFQPLHHSSPTLPSPHSRSTLTPLSEGFLNTIASPQTKLQPELEELLVILIDYIKQTYLPTIQTQSPYFYTILPPITQPQHIPSQTPSKFPLHIHQHNNLAETYPPFSTALIKDIYLYIAHLSHKSKVPFEFLSLFGASHTASKTLTQDSPTISSCIDPTTAMNSHPICLQRNDNSKSHYESLFPAASLPWRIHIDQSDAIPAPCDDEPWLSKSNAELFSTSEFDPSLSQIKKDILTTQHRRIQQLSEHEQQLLLRDLLANRSQTLLSAPNRLISPYKLTAITHGVASHSIPMDIASNHTVWKKLRHINSSIVTPLFARAVTIVFGDYYFTTHYFKYAKKTMDRLEGKHIDGSDEQSKRPSKSAKKSKMFQHEGCDGYEQMLVEGLIMGSENSVCLAPHDVLSTLPGHSVSLGTYSSIGDQYQEGEQLLDPFADF